MSRLSEAIEGTQLAKGQPSPGDGIARIKRVRPVVALAIPGDKTGKAETDFQVKMVLGDSKLVYWSISIPVKLKEPIVMEGNAWFSRAVNRYTLSLESGTRVYWNGVLKGSLYDCTHRSNPIQAFISTDSAIYWAQLINISLTLTNPILFYFSPILVAGTSLLPDGLMGVVYLLWLGYLFIGIAIISDIFME
jgi:hypothetical protein